MEPTTLGYEKKTNPYLQLSKEEFIKKVTAEELVVPKYFKKMEELNLNGPPLISEMSNPKPFSLIEFEEEMQEQNMIVIDTRMPYAYAGSHIPIQSACGLEEPAFTRDGSSIPISTSSSCLSAQVISTSRRHGQAAGF